MNKNVLIIAEAGVNHNGDIRLAKKFVDAAVTQNNMCMCINLKH